jgi:hypothetical protein
MSSARWLRPLQDGAEQVVLVLGDRGVDELRLPAVAVRRDTISRAKRVGGRAPHSRRTR